MPSNDNLIDQLNRAFKGDAWHGPALRRLLDGVTEHQANQHPLANAHSIGEIVRHVSTWIDVVARRVGGEVVESASVDDWPDGAKASWSRLLEDLDRAEGRLCDAVGRLRAGDSDSEREVFGVLQHNVYHTGQIAVLKKAL